LEIIARFLLSLCIRRREGNAFGLEQLFRFALPGFGGMALLPVRAPVMAGLVPEGWLQQLAALGEVSECLVLLPTAEHEGQT
jgi:hypothetical protein